MTDKGSSLECTHCGKVALGEQLFIMIIVLLVSDSFLSSDFLKFKDGELKCFSHTAKKERGTETLPADVPPRTVD